MTSPPGFPAVPRTPRRGSQHNSSQPATPDFYALLKSPETRPSEDASRRTLMASAVAKSPSAAAMRELSQTLKTRLAHASTRLQTSPLPNPVFSSPKSAYSSPYRGGNGRRGSFRLDDVASRSTTGAATPDRVSLPLLTSMQQQQHPKPPVLRPVTNSLSINTNPFLDTSNGPSATPAASDAGQLEQDAIISLVSMASPVKYSRSASHSQSSSISLSEREKTPPAVSKAALGTALGEETEEEDISDPDVRPTPRVHHHSHTSSISLGQQQIQPPQLDTTLTDMTASETESEHEDDEARDAAALAKDKFRVTKFDQSKRRMKTYKR